VSDREPTGTERQRAHLTAMLPGWYVWPTYILFTNSHDWSAMPEGADSAAVAARSPDELVEAVKGWDVDEYIAKTEAELAGTPDDWKSKREMLAANLWAARSLREG
jgi:hypothetical protein